MSQKVKVLTLAFLIIAMIGFARIMTLHGQEYETVGGTEVVIYCKDFNALSLDKKTLWLNGYNTGVSRFEGEGEEGAYQPDMDALINTCAEDPSKDINDAVDQTNVSDNNGG